MAAALRLLAHRGRSVHEIRLALERRGFPAPEQSAAIARLTELGYLDDARFARDRALVLLREGKLGPRGALERLVAQGLSEPAARQALAWAEAELGFDAKAAARQLLERRRATGAKARRLLLSRGFSEDLAEELAGESLDPPAQDE